jgi:flagellar biogenesis protein FliO
MLEQNLGGSLLGILAVLSLLFLFLLALRWFKPRYLYGEQHLNPKLKLEAELQLGLRQRLVQIKTDNRHFLVVLDQNKIQLIDSWLDPESSKEADYACNEKFRSDEI